MRLRFWQQRIHIDDLLQDLRGRVPLVDEAPRVATRVVAMVADADIDAAIFSPRALATFAGTCKNCSDCSVAVPAFASGSGGGQGESSPLATKAAKKPKNAESSVSENLAIEFLAEMEEPFAEERGQVAFSSAFPQPPG
jgi:hypothetical protein